MKARQARQIRRRCQQNSQRPNHCGISELWLAPPEDAQAILETLDERLRFWLLGFTELPATLLEKLRNRSELVRLAGSVATLIQYQWSRGGGHTLQHPSPIEAS